MNIKTLKKIQKGREIFPKFNLKKKGRNNYQKFNYFQLKDILPIDNAICKTLNLATKLNQQNESNITLEVWDLDQDDDQEPVLFYSPACVVNNGSITQGSQEHGSIQTYSWKYLYFQLWHITDSEEIDASEISLDTPVNKLPTDVTEERVNQLAQSIGKSVYDKGLDNSDRTVLTQELNHRLRQKLITNDEFIEVKKLIDQM